MLITAMQLTENFNIGMMGNGLVFWKSMQITELCDKTVCD